MKRLFHEKYETYNKDAAILYDEFNKFLHPLIKKYSQNGYALKEVERILIDQIELCITLNLAKRNLKNYKDNKEC